MTTEPGVSGRTVYRVADERGNRVVTTRNARWAQRLSRRGYRVTARTGARNV